MTSLRFPIRLITALFLILPVTVFYGSARVASGQTVTASGDGKITMSPGTADEMVATALASFDRYLATLDKVMKLTDDQKKETRAKYEAAIREYLKANYDKMNEAMQESAKAQTRVNQLTADYRTFTQKTLDASVTIPPEAQAALALTEDVKYFEGVLRAHGTTRRMDGTQIGVPLTDEQKKVAKEKFLEIWGQWYKESYPDYAKAHKELTDAFVAAPDQAAKDKALAKFRPISKQRQEALSEATQEALDAAGAKKTP